MDIQPQMRKGGVFSLREILYPFVLGTLMTKTSLVVDSHRRKVNELVKKGLIRKEDVQIEEIDPKILTEVEDALKVLMQFPGMYLPMSLITPSTVRIFDQGFYAGKGNTARILVERYLGLSDVLLSLIICRGLWLKYGFRISFATSKMFFPIAARFDFIDQIMTGEEADRFHFDLKIRLQGEVDFLPLCEKNHRLDLMAAISGLEREFIINKFRIPVHRSEKREARKVLEEVGACNGDFVIGVNVKSFADLRTWPIDRTLELVKRLAQVENTKIVILENQKERLMFSNIENIIIPESTAIETLIGLVDQCDLIVCPDSGVLHLAGLLNKPTVALFGPILPDYRIRYYPKCRALFHPEIKCVPCWDLQTYNCIDTDFQACLKAITVNEVFDAITKMRKK